MSARECAAAANRSGCAPLTSSQLLARTGSMRNPGSAGSGSVAVLVVHAFMVAYRPGLRQNGPVSASVAPKKLSIAFQCRSAASAS